MMVDRTEHRIHSEEYNRVDWRSTPRYVGNRQTKVGPRHRSPAYASKVVGTAFGTARLVGLALSADDAFFFRSVGPFHHRCDCENFLFVLQYFMLVLNENRSRNPGPDPLGSSNQQWLFVPAPRPDDSDLEYGSYIVSRVSGQTLEVSALDFERDLRPRHISQGFLAVPELVPIAPRAA
jgi:hypothetical protein